jgi:hypothetical protein
VALLALASAVLLIAASAAAIVRAGDDQAIAHPARWDPRVEPLARFVEGERGHKFDHPVDVEFLADAEFREEITVEEDELDDEAREQLASAEGALRALGLLPADADLFEEFNSVAGEATLAFYDFRKKRIRVRGTRLTDETRATLVHELTHALQDQQFDVDRDFDTDGESFAFTALVEGDAIRVEQAWVEENASDDYQQPDVRDILEDVPSIVVVLFGAAHEVGTIFVQALLAADGREGLDGAFREPPTTEEAVLDPFAYLAGDNEPVTVRPLDPPGDRRAVDRGDFGALLWFLTLAARLEPAEALHVIEGWGGDAYVLVEQDDVHCIRVAYVGDTAEDTDRMARALDKWVDGLPDASVRREDGRVELDSCEPSAGEQVEVADNAIEALILVLMRAGVGAGFLQGTTPEKARCAANAFVARLTLADLKELSELTDADEFPQEYQQRAFAAFAGCQ